MAPSRHPKDFSFSNLDANEDFRRIYSQNEYNVMRRASKSFENLVALANDRERLDVARTAARKVVWRDTGEPPSHLDTFLECLEHASRGGLRKSCLDLQLSSRCRGHRMPWRVQLPSMYNRSTDALYNVLPSENRRRNSCGSNTLRRQYLRSPLSCSSLP